MNDNYRISAAQEDMDVRAIHAFLCKSYWAEGIPLETVDSAIKNSLCFGVFSNSQQVGFARVVTDRATFAYLADVYILQAHRGLGLSKVLVQEVLQHRDLQGLRRFMLATMDAHDLYAKFGFVAVDQPQRLMQIWNPDVYQKNQAR